MKKIKIIFLAVLIATSCSPAWAEMTLTSPAFKNGEAIPPEYTCAGKNVNPPLIMSGVPIEARSLALIVDDPDAPSGDWVHWVVYNISPQIGSIHENSVPGLQGRNDFNKTDYSGPCPPGGSHRYVFKLYALDSVLGVKPGLTKAGLDAEMAEHILGVAHLTGTFAR